MADIATVNESNNGKRFGRFAPKSATAQLKSVGVGRKSVRVGLDIGSSAVRAAEVTGDGDNARVTRFAQVGLPPGTVVEGEVRDQATVATAIKRLWSEGGFSRRDVVVGISSQRSMVRQVEMPKMSSPELRSALRYEMGGLLPIPVEQAVFDFVELGPGKQKDGGAETTQVLLVVAQREIVMDHIEVVRRAGLKVRAVDSSPLALLRAYPHNDGGLEAIVSLGAQLVVVAVREGTTPRFVRTVTRGDQSFATPRPESVADLVANGAAVRGNGAVVSANGASAPSPALATSASSTATVAKLDPTVEEVRGSIEYFLSSDQGARLQSVALTGGGALAEGVAERFARVLAMPVRTADVGLQYDAASLDLTDPQVKEASFRWGAAVGLALWGTSDAPAVSLVPAEVKERQQYHRALAASGAGLAVVALALGSLSYSRVETASNVATQINIENAQAAALQGKIAKLEPYVAIRSELEARRGLAVQALAGDVDWVGLLSRIDAALPPGVNITGLSVTRASTTASGIALAPTASTTTASASDNVGQITMSLTTNGGAPSVAQFVSQMWSVPGLYGLWVSSTSNGQGASGSADTTFSATANITSAAFSNRAAALPGGQQ